MAGSVVCVPNAQADGGHIALHATYGPYTVTMFTTPVPLTAGPVDLTLLVQPARGAGTSSDGDTSLLDATASGTLQLPGSSPVVFSFARAGAGSALLVADVRLPAPGDYALTLRVSAPQRSEGVFQAVVPVARDYGRRTTVVVMVLLPVLLVLLFLLNQWSKSRSYVRS